MAFLTDNGTCTYNSVAIVGVAGSPVSSTISGKVVRDEADRQVKFIEYKVEVKGYVHGDVSGTCDDKFAALRIALTTPRRALVYTSKGFGTLSVNVAGGTVKDVAWGPKPELISFTPIGDSTTAMIEWECMVRIPECVNAQYERRIMALTYGQTFDVDKNGYVVMRTEIDCEIPMTQHRAGDTTIPDHVDNYLTEITPPKMLGFERTATRTISKDKRVMRLTITDTQLPFPLPGKASQADVTHSVKSSLSKGFIQWEGKIGGTIHVPAEVPKEFAAGIFQIILSSRLQHAQAQVRGQLIPAVHRASKNQETGIILIHEAEFGEKMFGTESSFNIGYRMIGSSLPTILAMSGLWRPIEGTTFAAWQDAMDGANNHRPDGVRGLRGRAQDDALIDLCASVKPPRVTPQKNAPRQPGRGTSVRFGGGSPTGSQSTPRGASSTRGGGSGSLRPVPNGGSNDGSLRQLPPNQTWLRWTSRLRRIERDRIVVHDRLGGQVIHLPTMIQADGSAGQVGGDSRRTRPAVMSPDQSLIQEVGDPNITVQLIGEAIRIGYPISPPRLERVGGVRATQQDSDESGNCVIGAAGGHPVYHNSWVITYVVPRVPPTVPIPANPALGVGGSQ